MNIFLVVFFVAVGSSLGIAATADQQTAITELEQDVRTNPNNPELWLHLGFAYRKAEQVEKAQEAFQKTLSLNPTSKEALSMLAMIYEKKQQKAEAIRLWKTYQQAETDPSKRDMAEKHIHTLSQ